MFQHRDAVGRGKGHRPARAALADDHRNQRHADGQAGLGRPRDGFGLAAFLGALAGIGAGGVDQGDHRETETVRHVQQPRRLAIALGPGHAEVAVEPRLGVMALFMADHHHRPVIDPRQPAHHRQILAELPVAGQRGEFGKERLDVILAMRPLRMPRHLAFAPGCQLAVEVLEHRRGLAVERIGLFVHIHRIVALPGNGPQLLCLALDLGQRFLKIEIMRHATTPFLHRVYGAMCSRMQSLACLSPAVAPAPARPAAKPPSPG